MILDRKKLAGILLFLALFASLANGLSSFSALPAGCLQFVAVILIWSQVPRGVRRLSLFLALVGALTLFASNSLTLLFLAFSKNHAIVSMLVGISFLGLLPLPKTTQPLPVGRRALWQTIFGVHWFGAVINMSVLVLFGDRMAGGAKHLDSEQVQVVTRGFSLAALWSPFFVAMGVAVTNAPGAKVSQLMLWGLPLSQLLLVALVWQMSRSGGAINTFSGCPVSIEAVVGPVLLVLAVVVSHFTVPDVAIVSLVTLFVPLYVLIAVGRKGGWGTFLDYVGCGLPKMGSEVVLFVAAGVLGVGVASMFRQVEVPLIIDGSEGFWVATGLAIIIALSGIGVHPVVGIAAVGAVFAQYEISPNLMAMSFLMGWGLGVLVNPISGIHLLVSGRYGFSSRKVWRSNTVLVACGYVVCCGWLYILSRFV